MDLNQSKWASDIEDKSNTILDVRTPEEFNEGYIPKSINLNIYDASSFMSKIQSFNKENNFYI